MIQLQSSTRITRSPELLATDLDGEVVLMSIERGNYYGLERSARRIWELLDTPKTLVELCASLGKEYAASPDVIEADVKKFVLKMFEETVVTLS
jgi:hypothetical protein